jgi:hypothetical protein
VSDGRIRDQKSGISHDRIEVDPTWSWSLATGGGDAWLLPGEAWPACCKCGGPLNLFLQLDLSALPSGLGTRFGRGLLQVFHCADMPQDKPRPDDELAKLARHCQARGTNLLLNVPPDTHGRIL